MGSSQPTVVRVITTLFYIFITLVVAIVGVLLVVVASWERVST